MKTTKHQGIYLLICLLFILMASTARAQETKVKITAIRSGKGKIILNVFKENAAYDSEKPYKVFSFDKKALVNGAVTVSCQLEPGTYGITLLDDENENGKIDKNLIGIPKEGFGFSNFFMTKMKKPAFDDFKVDLKAHRNIEIKAKYM